MKPDKWKEFRDHVAQCSSCVVSGDGGVWTCAQGAALRQAALKAQRT